jgi:hypothetical protein
MGMLSLHVRNKGAKHHHYVVCHLRGQRLEGMGMLSLHVRSKGAKHHHYVFCLVCHLRRSKSDHTCMFPWHGFANAEPHRLM